MIGSAPDKTAVLAFVLDGVAAELSARHSIRRASRYAQAITAPSRSSATSVTRAPFCFARLLQRPRRHRGADRGARSHHDAHERAAARDRPPIQRRDPLSNVPGTTGTDSPGRLDSSPDTPSETSGSTTPQSTGWPPTSPKAPQSRSLADQQPQSAEASRAASSHWSNSPPLSQFERSFGRHRQLLSRRPINAPRLEGFVRQLVGERQSERRARSVPVGNDFGTQGVAVTDGRGGRRVVQSEVPSGRRTA